MRGANSVAYIASKTGSHEKTKLINVVAGPSDLQKLLPIIELHMRSTETASNWPCNRMD